MGKLDPPSILFLVPAHGATVTTPFLESMLEFSRFAIDSGIEFNWIVEPGASLISLCRSQLISMAMELEDWTHILFVDNDMGFEPMDIMRLLIADKDVIAGQAPVKSYPLTTSSALSDIIEEDEQAVRVNYVGTGFMMIQRYVVERMMDYYKQHKSFEMPDGNYYDQTRVGYVDLFDTITNNAHVTDKDLYLTEDYAFCLRARACGFQIWAHKNVMLTHTGMHTFSFKNEAKMLKDYKRIGKTK